MNLKAGILVAALIQSSYFVSGAPILLNGDFETGDLTGWTTFLTPNGSIGSTNGVPDVVPFDVTGGGTPSDAAQFEVGELAFSVSTRPKGEASSRISPVPPANMMSRWISRPRTLTVFPMLKAACSVCSLTGICSQA